MRRLTPLIALFGLVAGCNPGESPPIAKPSVSSTIVDRVTRLEAPADSTPQLHFIDRHIGYAMFVKWEPGNHEMVLYGTQDGAVTWKHIELPKADIFEPQLYFVDQKRLVIQAKPGGSFISEDYGATWKPGDIPLGTDYGRFYIDMGANYEGPALIRDNTDAAVKVAVPSGYEHAGLTNTDDQRIWLTAIRDGQPITALSSRGTAGFTPVAVPRQQGRDLMGAHVVLNGGETWLFADQEWVEVSTGPKGLAMKATGLPLIWLLDNGAWKPWPIKGIEERLNTPYSVAPVGNRTLIVTSFDGTWYVDGQGAQPFKGLRLDHVYRLTDGTIFGGKNAPGEAYLGVGEATSRTWIRVQVMRAQG